MEPNLRPRLLVALAATHGLVATSPITNGGGFAEVFGPAWEALPIEARKSLEHDLAILEGHPSRAREFLASTESEAPVIGSMAETIRGISRVQSAGAISPGAPKLSGDRYTVRREHARGGMGRILLVVDNAVGREVAMKVLLPPRPDDSITQVESDRERFFREARITGQLEHPNIVSVYEIGSAPDGSVFYTMKFMRGETMAQRLESIQLDPTLSPPQRLAARLKLLDAFLDVGHAMAYAHARGVVNRDLKPQNIMIGGFGETVVLDWGLASVKGQEDRAREDIIKTTKTWMKPPVQGGDAARLTADGSVVGTPVYMSPEAARGDLDQVDERSDVYALGVILYEILTGRPPFDGESLLRILKGILYETPPPILKLEPAAPRELVAVVAAALIKDRDRRLETVQKMVDDVRAWREGRPMRLYRHSPYEQAWRFVKRNPALSVASLLAVLALVIGTGVSLRYARQAEYRAANEAEAKLQSDKSAASERVSRLEAQAALLRAEGERLATVSRSKIGENPALALLLGIEAAKRSPGSSSTNALLESLREIRERRHFYGHEMDVIDARLSPDGQWVATAGYDRTARLWSVETGREVARCDEPRGEVSHVVFNGDGSKVLALAGDKVGRVCEVPSLKVLSILRGHARTFRGGEFLAGGGILTWSEDGTARVWSADGTCEASIAMGTGNGFACGSPDGKSVLVLAGGVAQVWDSGKRQARKLEGHEGAVAAVRFSADGRSLISAGENGEAILRDAASLEIRHRWRPAGDEPVRGLLVNRDGRLAFAAGASLFVWDAGGTTCAGRFEFNSGRVDTDVLNPEWKKYVHTMTFDVGIADLGSGKSLGTLRGHEYDVRVARFSADGRWVTSGSRDRTAILWSVDAGLELSPLRWAVGKPVVAVSPDGTRGIVREGEALEHRDFESGRLLWGATVPGMTAAWITRDGQRALFLAEGGLHVYSMAGGKRERILPLSPDPNAVSLSSDGDVLLWRTQAGETATWRLSTGEKLSSGPNPHVGRPDASGRRLLIPNHADQTMSIVDAATGALLLRYARHTGTTLSGEFSPDGRWCASTAADASCKIWDSTDGHEIALCRWPRMEEISCTWSPDGRKIAVISKSTVIVFNAATGEELLQVPEGTPPGGIGFSPDSSHLGIRTSDGTTFLFPLDPLPAALRAAPRILRTIEFARFRMGSREELEAYNAMYRKWAAQPWTSCMTAEKKIQDGDLDGAIVLMREAVSFQPKFPEWRIALAESLALKSAAFPAGSAERTALVDEVFLELGRAAELNWDDVNDMSGRERLAAFRNDPRWARIADQVKANAAAR